MKFTHEYKSFTLTSLIFLPILLSLVLIILNKVFNKLLQVKSINLIKSSRKGLETYEFGTNSIGSVVTISNNQFIVLAILFLVFDIELIFLIPWVVQVEMFWSISTLTLLIFTHFIIYSLLIELNERVLTWYSKNSKQII